MNCNRRKRILTLLLMTAGVFVCLTGCQEAPRQQGDPGTTPPTAYTAAPTSTPIPISEPTSTMTPTVTDSPVPTNTATPTNTPTPTNTLAPTNTPTPTSTPVPTPDLSLSEKIPVIYVETEGAQVVTSREEYVNCEVSVYHVAEEFAISQKAAGIRVRGNSSAYYGNVDKILANEVPYRIKFEKKTGIIGLNDGAECKSWVLLRADEGLVRDDIAFRLGRAIFGERYYCSDGQLVHLYLNGEFKGVYLLCEQSQVNKHRVNITEAEENYEGIDIGYLVEIDNYANAEDHPFFRMYYEKATVTDIEGETQKFGWANYSVKSDTYSKAQEEHIANYVKGVFKIVYEACELGNYLTFDENYALVAAPYETAEETVAAVLDLDSVVASYILEEIMHDYDCGEGSFYMCVDFAADSDYQKLTFVCPWDYDWTCRESAQGAYYAAAFNKQSFVDKYGDRSNPWFVILMKQDWFFDRVQEKWTELQAEGAIAAAIKEERDYMEEYKSDLNRKKKIATATGDAVLDWIEKRILWLDEVWKK